MEFRNSIVNNKIFLGKYLPKPHLNQAAYLSDTNDRACMLGKKKTGLNFRICVLSLYILSLLIEVIFSLILLIM